MKRLFASVLLALALACAGSNAPRTPPDSSVPPRDPAADVPSWVERTLESLTLEQKVGQMIHARARGDFANETDPDTHELLQLARRGIIGGVVFFRGTPYATAALANRLQEASALPLLMASDYEWGPGMRVDGATVFPKAMALGAGGTVADLELQAEVTAREARAMGVHLVLNPVLDLNTNPKNAVINTRSFGEDPERAARLGAAFVRRAQSLGVLTTAKHFPGHGASEEDSHVTLPTVRLDGEHLRDVELRPFRAAIDAGVAAVMTAHIAVPGLGGPEHLPATLSSKILGGVLRGELGFNGLIVSDALDMGGARQGAWDGEVAVAAVAAGVDMLLVPPDPRVAFHAILRGVRRGDLSSERIDDSVRRILAAKARLGLHRKRTVDLRDLGRIVRPDRLQSRIEELAGRAITLIADRVDEPLLPFRGEAPPDLLLVEFVLDGDRDAAPEHLEEALARRAARVRRVRLSPASFAARSESLTLQPGEVVVFASFARSRYLLGPGEVSRAISEKLGEIAAAGSPIVFASLGNPYVLAAAPDRSARIATYDASPASQRALARALFGEIGVTGKLPVTLSPKYPRGHGLLLEPRRMKLEALRDPRGVGMSRRGLQEAANLVRDAVGDGAAPGAVVLVARRGKIVLEQAFGRLSYDDDAAPVKLDTIYDLASLTKVIATTTLAMILHERERLDLESPVSAYIPEFSGGDKDRVLVKDLLAHSGGLLWWTDLYKKFEGTSPDEARKGYIDAILQIPLDYEPRTKMSYSDLGLLLLGEILERVTGRRLDALARDEIFRPLGMSDTLFTPPSPMWVRVAPTEEDPWRGRIVHGEVHDENAYGLGGVAPHAGLFSTARSLAPFAQMLLNGGAYGGERLVNATTISLFTRRAGLSPDSSRALGWDTPSEPSSAGRLFSSASFGHTGFTGTSMWIDPERELFAILLTNRVHPTRENRKIYELRPKFHDAVMRAITDLPVEPRATN